MGALTMLESLLGPMLAEPDWVLRCVFMVRAGGEPFAPEAGPEPFQNDLRSGDDCAEEWAKSTGVGGVLTMTGAGLSPVGGVLGGRPVSTFGCCTLDRLSDGATLAAAGGSIMGGTCAGSGSAPGVACCLPEGGGRFLDGLCRSGLELLELFLGLKMPLNLPPGDCDRRDGLCGGRRPVLLRPILRSFGSMDTDRLGGNVADLAVLLLESVDGECDFAFARWLAWTAEDDVVR